MVKGISRRIVVVQPSDSDVFEQAIFIVKDKAPKATDVMKEACNIAEQYLGKPHVKRYVRKRWTNLHLFLSGLAGAGIVSSLWVISTIFSIPLF